MIFLHRFDQAVASLIASAFADGGREANDVGRGLSAFRTLQRNGGRMCIPPDLIPIRS